MNKPKLYIITDYFPYLVGEQFLETEIIFWSKLPYFDVYVMPNLSENTLIRKIPFNIHLDFSLVKEKYKYNKIIYLLKALFKLYKYKNELKLIVQVPIRFIELIRCATRIEIYKTFFSNFIIKNNIEPNNVIFYTYWNNEISYALAEMKKKYNFLVVSRIHRSDIYEERRRFHYMPLKRVYINNFDKIFVITESQKKYLNQIYQANNKIIDLSRLGVLDRKIKTEPSSKGKIVIISCSFLIKVKRVDKIIKSLFKLSQELKQLEIQWYHIGDGTLMQELKDLAKKLLDRLGNVKYQFLGNLKNEEVFNFYKNNRIDVFINVSESEGLPVSIMEALSCGIPVIAPNVGGISEAVTTGYNGVLLSNNPTEEEIVKVLKDIDYFKNEKTRQNAYLVFKEKFDAEKNYSNFIENIYQLFLMHKGEVVK